MYQILKLQYDFIRFCRVKPKPTLPSACSVHTCMTIWSCRVFPHRRRHTSARDCPVNKQYAECATVCRATCAEQVISMISSELCQDCYPGCVCEPGRVWQDGECVEPKDCKCSYRHGDYEPDDEILNGCNKWCAAVKSYVSGLLVVGTIILL